MNISVVGSRTISDYCLIESTILETLELGDIDLVVSGGAAGVDSLGELFAKKYDIKTKIFYPDWEKFGRAAGMIRNKDIIINSDVVFAFWDGKSKGTKSSIDIAKKENKRCILKIIERCDYAL